LSPTQVPNQWQFSGVKMSVKCPKVRNKILLHQIRNVFNFQCHHQPKSTFQGYSGVNITNQFVQHANLPASLKCSKRCYSVSPTFALNNSAYFMLQTLQRVSYFGVILTNAVVINSVKNYRRKSFSALVPKMLVKLTPGTNVTKLFFGAIYQFSL
jgi:hypothetical protein